MQQPAQDMQQPPTNRLRRPAQPGEAATQDEASTQGEDIVVTGTLIRNPNLEQSTPVNVTTADTIELKQSNVAEEVLRELPGIVPNIGSAVNNGNGGASFVDLRGLGNNRNIVLLDGNRLVPFGLIGSFDLNNVPLALVERVDALTGAAVTTYGADAITGVVNFITKKDFAGVEVAASEQITEKGDGNFMRADLTIGANFDDGRGNAVLSIGYQNSDPVYQGARDFSVFQVSFLHRRPAGSGTAVPSRFSGTRPLIAGTCTPDTDPATANGGVQPGQLGRLRGRLRRRRSGRPLCAVQLQSLQHLPDAVHALQYVRSGTAMKCRTPSRFMRAACSPRIASRSIIAPSGSFGGTVNINLNNPFLPAACATSSARSTSIRSMQSTRRASRRRNAPPQRPRPARAIPTIASSEPAAWCRSTLLVRLVYPMASSRPARDIIRTPASRSTVVRPKSARGSATSRQRYSISASALRGPLTSTIDWDISGSYGQSDRILTVANFTLQSRFRQGSLVSLVGGVPTCHDTSNNCVPLDIFGPEGSITPDMADYLTESAASTISTSLGQLRGLLSGDFGYGPALGEPADRLRARYRIPQIYGAAARGSSG